MTYVDWFNQRRLHGEITSDATYTTPAEAEANHYRQKQPAEQAITQYPEQSSNPGRFRSTLFRSWCRFWLGFNVDRMWTHPVTVLSCASTMAPQLTCM
jgi:hypothetical protein